MVFLFISSYNQLKLSIHYDEGGFFMYLIGIIIFLVFLSVLALFVSTPLVFIDLPSLMVVLFLTIPILMASGLLTDFVKGFKLMGQKENTFSVIELNRILQANKLAMFSFILSGVIGTLVGTISIMAKLSDVETIGANLSVAILTLLYALVLTFFILPVQARVKAILSTMD